MVEIIGTPRRAFPGTRRKIICGWKIKMNTFGGGYLEQQNMKNKLNDL